MTRVRTSRCTTAFVAFLLVAAAGCAPGFVQDAARTSLASFINGVFATAVNETVGP